MVSGFSAARRVVTAGLVLFNQRIQTFVSCNAFKLGISSEQDARTTARIAPLLILRFKCRTVYQAGRSK